ncbi:hypothetical protein FXO38_32145 [Capsicum annuum]|nr:hypothetical protein FXO38_32145 [Capsicum annuum]KAF3638436.1 hypothetical protein FXO37_24402 [Capsicum annuum]
MQTNSLRQNRPEGVKQYFSATTLGQHILTTLDDHFNTLQMPKNFQQERFRKYQHVNLGTLHVILDAGTFVVTLFSDLSMSLSDLSLTEALKIQVQILETPDASTYPTIHYQSSWQVENHEDTLCEDYDVTRPNSDGDEYRDSGHAKLIEEFQCDPIKEYLNSPDSFEDIDPKVEEEQRHPESADPTNMMISKYNTDLVLLAEVDEAIGMIPTSYIDLDTKLDRAPHLSKYQPSHKRSKKAKRKDQSSEETMEIDKFPIEDKVLYANLASIPKSVCNKNIGVTEDIQSLLIDGQTHPLIIDDYLEKISSPISEGEFNQLSKLIEEINMVIEGINMLFELETPHVELKIYPFRWDKPLQVIAFIDTDATASILNPDIIPDDLWDPHFRTFGTAIKGGVLITKLIMRHLVMIGFFPGILYRTKLLGSNIPWKDLIISFDIYR